MLKVLPTIYKIILVDFIKLRVDYSLTLKVPYLFHNHTFEAIRLHVMAYIRYANLA